MSANKSAAKPVPVVNPVISTNKQQPRVIKLTPQQFAALKSGKSGKIVLAGAGNNYVKRESITLASQPRKLQRTEELNELKRKLDIEVYEADRLRQEARKRDDMADKLRKQIESLSNI